MKSINPKNRWIDGLIHWLMGQLIKTVNQRIEIINLSKHLLIEKKMD